MRSRPHAILFDLDGTLLDSLHSIATAMNEALEALCLPTHPIEAYKHFVEDGVRDLVAAFAREALEARPQEGRVA
jgi:phosphoglycolate phosphatase